jgi:hypothetical protein
MISYAFKSPTLLTLALLPIFLFHGPVAEGSQALIRKEQSGKTNQPLKLYFGSLKKDHSDDRNDSEISNIGLEIDRVDYLTNKGWYGLSTSKKLKLDSNLEVEDDSDEFTTLRDAEGFSQIRLVLSKSKLSRIRNHRGHECLIKDSAFTIQLSESLRLETSENKKIKIFLDLRQSFYFEDRNRNCIFKPKFKVFTARHEKSCLKKSHEREEDGERDERHGSRHRAHGFFGSLTKAFKGLNHDRKCGHKKHWDNDENDQRRGRDCQSHKEIPVKPTPVVKPPVVVPPVVKPPVINPPVVNPPVVNPPVINPPVVNPPVVNPPVINPPVVNPPVVNPPVINPPVVNPPVVNPPVINPPVVNPPVVNPPVIDPPVVNPPVVNPPVIDPPIVNPPVVNPPVINPPVVNPPVIDPPVVNPPVVNPPVIDPPVVNPPVDSTNQGSGTPSNVVPTLVISNFGVLEIFLTGVTVAWNTDIASSSQIIVTNLSTGVETKTAIDSTQTTKHQLFVDGLEVGISYQLKAVSISSTGKGSSQSITFVKN